MNETIRGLIATTINRLANAGYSETSFGFLLMCDKEVIEV